jgi:hypothetical protein
MKPRIKVLLPKFEALKGISWAKELLLSFIGTTLSIVLTFGTAHFVEQKQNREAGRQTAMMVIHDIENTADLFTAWEKQEEQYFNCAQYVLEHRNEIDAISQDTLQAFTTYVAASGNQQYNYDASSETLFLSSQDVWENIDCPSFIDAVQGFFYHRRIVFESLNKDGMFARPVPNTEYYTMLFSDGDFQEKARSLGQNFAKQYIGNGRVQSYIYYSYHRRHFLSQYAEYYRTLANECKFMMDISDSELHTYIASRKRTGHPVKEKNLIGRWEVEANSNVHVEREFFKDHTFVNTSTTYYSYGYYTGKVEFTFQSHGTWELKGDSLIRVTLPECEVNMDKSKISYSKDKEAMMEQLLSSWEENWLAQKRAFEATGEQRISALVSIDAAGEKIKVVTIPEKEEEREETYYMVKKE